jgi:large subunit ribosomal protein L24
MGLRLKKGDLVQVMSGKDKGARGVILRVLPKKDKAVVEGVNIIKRHTKPRSQQDQGGIISREAAIHLSNLMIIDPETDKPTRYFTKVEVDGEGKRTKSRVSKSSGKAL